MKSLDDDGRATTGAWDSAVEHIKREATRGNSIPMLKWPMDKYMCIGSKAHRNKVGVSPHQPGLVHVPVEDQRILQSYIIESEALFERSIPSDEASKVREGVKLNGATTLSMPAIDGWQAKYYNSIAGCHGGVTLAMHIDEGDFGMGHISVQMETHTVENPILVYFCFPTLGFAIPLRRNEHLFFNPLVPHMLSSKRQKSFRILPLSMYLKKDVLGLNDNSLPLSDKHKQLQDVMGSRV